MVKREPSQVGGTVTFFCYVGRTFVGPTGTETFGKELAKCVVFAVFEVSLGTLLEGVSGVPGTCRPGRHARTLVGLL